MSTATVPHPASEQLRERARTLGADLKEIGSLTPEAAREQYRDVKATAQECVQQTREQLVKAKDGVENFIRERPLQSVMIATGVGVLAGLLLARRR